MNEKDRVFLKQGADLIEQLTSNLEAGLNQAAKDVNAITGLRSVATVMRIRAVEA
jgi:hypothetical protein